MAAPSFVPARLDAKKMDPTPRMQQLKGPVPWLQAEDQAPSARWKMCAGVLKWMGMQPEGFALRSSRTAGESSGLARVEVR